MKQILNKHHDFIVIICVLSLVPFVIWYAMNHNRKRVCNHDSQEDWIVVDKMPDLNHRSISVYWYHLNGADYQFSDSSDFYYIGDFLLADSIK